MSILALDTCFDACSAAARTTHGQQAGRHALMRVGHAEALMPFVAEVMEEVGLKPTDLERIAVTRGPGTFTGTRIGVAAARALGLATGAKIIGFSSFHAIAQAVHRQAAAAQAQGDILIIRPARRGTHDCQAFTARGEPLSEPVAKAPTELAAYLVALLARDTANPMRVIGSGADELAQAWMATPPGLLWGLDKHAAQSVPSEPDARDLLEIAARTDAATAAAVTPLYLRPADAQPSSKPVIARA